MENAEPVAIVPVNMTKGKFKKFYNKLIEVGFTDGLVNADDPEGRQLENNVFYKIYRIHSRTNTRVLDELTSFIKNKRTRANIIKTIKEMSEEDRALLKQELVNYLKPNLPSYDSANKYIHNNIIDLDVYRVRYFKGLLCNKHL